MTDLSDAQRIAVALDVLGVIYTPEGVGVWLYGRQDTLGGQCALDMLRQNNLPAFERAVRALGDWDDLHADDPKDWPMPDWMPDWMTDGSRAEADRG
ncbi:unannotated protein [freshwater metagenome]|uniref:Unannotated protein n=1 Tax=freshwater metagenome TaxID=449393 RepID=A0A6J7GS24_9ZZZZ|nr:hypothetical protein [Actinomycetota bacterium]